MLMGKIIGLEYKDWIHYIIVFASIAFTWTLYMGWFKDNLYFTILASFVTFVVVDKLAQKVLKL
jgi:hypothetical protein